MQIIILVLSKTKKISSEAQEAFVYIRNNVYEPTAPESTISRLMLRCAGERDIEVQEIMYQILVLKFYCIYVLSLVTRFK